MVRNRNGASPTQRFVGKIDFDGPWFKEDRCWEWTGATNGVGYGKLSVDGRLVYAHRFSYLLHCGSIPEGMEIDHLCRNRRCVNPGHLETVTHQENGRRGVGPQAVNAAKTHCTLGHPLSGDNLRMDKSGDRRCRKCNNAWQRQRYAEKRRRAVVTRPPGA